MEKRKELQGGMVEEQDAWRGAAYLGGWEEV